MVDTGDEENSQQPALFLHQFQKLVDRWDKCLNEYGRYVEK